MIYNSFKSTISERSVDKDLKQGVHAVHMCVNPDFRVIGDDLIESAHDHPGHNISGDDLILIEDWITAFEQKTVDLRQDHGEKQIADTLFTQRKGNLAGITLVLLRTRQSPL